MKNYKLFLNIFANEKHSAFKTDCTVLAWSKADAEKRALLIWRNNAEITSAWEV